MTIPATLQSSLQTLRQVLSVPRRRSLQTWPALSPAPGDPDALAAPGLQDRECDAASTLNRPKFLPRGPAPSLLPPLEGIARERAGGGRGTTQVSPRPRPIRGRGGRHRPRSPHPPIRTVALLNPTLSTASPGAPPPRLLYPTPGCEELLHFPKPTGAPTSALHPPAHSPRPPPPKKRKPDEPKTGAAGVGARRKGEGEGTYFSRRGAERCRREIKAQTRAPWSPADAVVSALQSWRRWLWRPQGTGTGTGARAAGAAQLGGRSAALRLGPRLRAAPLLAPLWLLAPTPGSHMTPAPLALRASRGWRGCSVTCSNILGCLMLVLYKTRFKHQLLQKIWSTSHLHPSRPRPSFVAYGPNMAAAYFENKVLWEHGHPHSLINNQ
ncbi:LOW QUALITY PROTEIN: potassium/sodium hyperpolarization-activated cyclic nucleotide-gated channel 4-like [Phacochoerus africanus]|uniref:LOW QUALITY PROTEIN: potassium/sodium hyperpolarization-activated cyclic nucleotide-gated channel 4-like n=1 Tax=Phacochoerus africanus TaxID=41426 RepID=UPI001FDA6E78|nr:LOW QUALITY PROTEIN: potassium/sodium hyperpolarization-activated cyclic nucleotide-gated channel 4-like [Phacochoerus africanus]